MIGYAKAEGALKSRATRLAAVAMSVTRARGREMVFGNNAISRRRERRAAQQAASSSRNNPRCRDDGKKMET